MTVSELLPCAFCGGEAQIVGDERYGFCVVCAASDCTVAMGESYDRDAMPDHQFRTPDDAIAAWNRRTSATYQPNINSGEVDNGDAAKGGDANVEAVRAKLLARSRVGFAKYGVTTERADLTLADWLTHLQEELMDAAVYVEAAKRATPPAQAAEAVGRVIGTTQGDGWWRYEVSGEGLEPGLGGCHISMKPAGSVAKPATMTMTDALAVMHDAALRLRSKGCTEFAADLDAARAAIAAIQAGEG